MYSISLKNVPTISLSEHLKSRQENIGPIGYHGLSVLSNPSTTQEESNLARTQQTSAKDNNNSSSNEQFPTQISDYAKAEKLYSQLQQQAWLDQLKS